MLLHTRSSIYKWFHSLLVVVLVLGIVFRFVNLDQKPYWHDEVYTSLRVAGYKSADVVQTLFNDQVITVEDVLKYQHLSPEQTAIDTIQRLAEEVPEHPPLYFLIARFWAEWFGSSITAMRSLPVLLSLLAFPAMYWLCWELFASPIVGWLAMALLAVSPIYVRYAQEARPYSLWIVITLISSAALVRAIRHKTVWHWSIYAIAVIAGLHCHLLSGLVFLGHGIYVMKVERFQLSRTVLIYLLTSLISIILFLPWTLIIWMNRTAFVQTTDWLRQPLPFPTLIKFWSVHLSRMIVAWHFKCDEVFAYLAIPTLILIIFALHYLCHQTKERTWLLILTLIGVTALGLVLPDLLGDGKRSTNSRYFSPSYLGLTMAIAYFLAHLLTRISTPIQQKLWQLLTALLISSSVLTSAIASQANTWWGWSEFDVEVSRMINQVANPLVISDMPLGMIMSLSHRLHPDTRMILVAEPDSFRMPNEWGNTSSDSACGDVLVYNPSDRLQATLQHQMPEQKLIYQFEDGKLVISLYQTLCVSRVEASSNGSLMLER